MPTDDPGPGAGVAADPDAEPPRPRLGRPPRISREQIIQAAQELGLADLTLKAVADRLGVSVAALYHHIDSRDDLARLVADRASARVRIPDDTGQHWALWLWEWARHNHDAFLAQPGLLAQSLDGGISARGIAAHLDAALVVLQRQGFEPEDAVAASELVSACVTGSVLRTVRDAKAAEHGSPIDDEVRRVVDEQGPDKLVALRTLLDHGGAVRSDAFHVQVATVLAGIAVTRGEDWQAVLTMIGDEAGSG